jgi:transposase
MKCVELTDAQSAFLESLVRASRRKDGRGRPLQDTRAVMNGVLRVLLTGAPLHDLRRCNLPHHTCHRHFKQCQRSGLVTQVLHKPAEDLHDRGRLDLSESIIDASFTPAKKVALVLSLRSAAEKQNHDIRRRP